jgi:hypothetical protein
VQKGEGPGGLLATPPAITSLSIAVSKSLEGSYCCCRDSCVAQLLAGYRSLMGQAVDLKTRDQLLPQCGLALSADVDIRFLKKQQQQQQMR